MHDYTIRLFKSHVQLHVELPGQAVQGPQDDVIPDDVWRQCVLTDLQSVGLGPGLYECMYVCMYVRTYVCIYVCMYVCTYTTST